MLKQNAQVAKVSAEVDEVAALRSNLTAHHCIHIDSLRSYLEDLNLIKFLPAKIPYRFSSAHNTWSLRRLFAEMTGDSGRPR